MIGEKVGGLPPKTLFGKQLGGIECSDVLCGGPMYCIHRYVPPVLAEAVRDWKLYELPLPVNAKYFDSAKTCVDALLKVHASMKDFRRCGADAERLAMLGYTIDDLVTKYRYPLEDVLSGLQLNWDQLLGLGFSVDKLQNRINFPVVALCNHAQLQFNATRMLRSAQLNYDALVEMNLEQEELFVLGFKTPLLMQLDMTGEQLTFAISNDEHALKRGVDWWKRAFGLTAQQLAALRTNFTIVNSDSMLRATYLALCQVVS